MRILRGGIAGLLLLSLTACVGEAGLKPGATYNGDAEAGLVLIKTWAGAENRLLSLRPFDTTQKRLVPYAGETLRHSHGYVLEADGTLQKSDDITKPRYHLLPLKVADYVIASLYVTEKARNTTICFSNGTYAFRANSGEILVLGAININGPTTTQMGGMGTSPSSMFDIALPKDEAEKVLNAFGTGGVPARYYTERPTSFVNGTSLLGSKDVCGGF
ncbi:hypothetical protein [Pacificispira sp.]|uniref:hypothetical protein n=1 Tax=Pacificispira sp. TaxID=2888761 RepID=UPI003B525C6E